MNHEERERLIIHAAALGMVVAIAAVRFIAPSGSSIPFALFDVAIAASALLGGMSPAIVATLTAVLLTRLAAPVDGVERELGVAALFAIQALAVAAIVARSTVRARRATAETAEMRGRLASLETHDRHATMMQAALERLDRITPEAAVVVVSAQGLIAEWTDGAQRLFGYPKADVVGADVSMLLADGAASKTLLLDALKQASTSAPVRWSAVQRRSDGSRFSADVDVSAIRNANGLFALAVQDLTRQRDWEAARTSSARAETLLRAEAEEARGQVAQLERLTDPWLNNPNDSECISDLLERLRSAIEADGVAVIYNTAVRTRVITADGIQPDLEGTRLQYDVRRHQTGRMALIQNDATRVAQASVLAWPGTTTSLLAVPVVLGGKVHALMEIVHERPRRSTDWDLVLARITADRAATLIAHQEYSQNNAVA